MQSHDNLVDTVASLAGMLSNEQLKQIYMLLLQMLKTKE